jgi:ABC-2 type transport system permease protein
MRVLAEERKQKTDQLLYALPVSMTKIIIGKFLAMVALLLIPTAIIAVYPLILSGYGAVPMAAAYGALFAFFLFACALLSIGMFLSSLASSPLISAVLSFGVLLFLYLMSNLADFVSGTAGGSLAAFAVIALLLAVMVWRMTKSILPAVVTGAVLNAGLLVVYLVKSSVFEGLFPSLMRALSPFERYLSFINGVFDVTSVVFYLTVTVLFVIFTIQVMEKRRWSE